MILATRVLLMAANLELKSKKTPDLTATYAELFNREVGTAATSTSCTSAGVFAINCTSYLLCAEVNGVFLGAEGTCPSQENFNPKTYKCSSSYICPSCIDAGFFCPTSTSFTLCAGFGVEVASNQLCPDGYYCNPKCTFPCLNYLPSC
jgi:hypothetical protein